MRQNSFLGRLAFETEDKDFEYSADRIIQTFEYNRTYHTERHKIKNYMNRLQTKVYQKFMKRFSLKVIPAIARELFTSYLQEKIQLTTT